MIIAPPVVLALASGLTKQVFTEIAKNRSASFKDIRDSVAKQNERQPDRKEIESAVKKLIDVSLVKERPAEVDDFRTYSVTADGLGVERKLRLSETT
jgi:hypothetical protein